MRGAAKSPEALVRGAVWCLALQKGLLQLRPWVIQLRNCSDPRLPKREFTRGGPGSVKSTTHCDGSRRAEGHGIHSLAPGAPAAGLGPSKELPFHPVPPLFPFPHSFLEMEQDPAEKEIQRLHTPKAILPPICRWGNEGWRGCAAVGEGPNWDLTGSPHLAVLGRTERGAQGSANPQTR